jgi:hypothetical protein
MSAPEHWTTARLPPLRMSAGELEAVIAAAGAGATLWLGPREGVTWADIAAALDAGWPASLFVQARGLELELAADGAQLDYHDETPRAAQIVRALWRFRAAAAAPAPRPGIGAAAGADGGDRRAVEVGQLAVTARAVAAVIDAMPPEATAEAIADPPRAVERGDAAALEAALAGGLRVAAPGICVELRADRAAVSVTDASARGERIIALLRPHRRRLSWLSHGDAPVLIGLLAPAAAALVAPAGWDKAAAGIATVPWLAYLMWVKRNNAYRWCERR